MTDWLITTLRPESSINDGERVLFRPGIDYWVVAFNVVVPILVCFAVCWWNVFYALLGLCVYTLLRLRRIVIWSIRAYQRYAPERVRLACVFVPSCSDYMILSIEKYGLIRGSIKGVKRLRRCHNPNGGEDYP